MPGGLPITSAILSNRFERRTFVLGAMQGGVGLLLAARLGYLAVAQNEKYQAASESNRVNLTLIPPRRGWILDRFGKALASNRADFRVDLIPDRISDPERTVAMLAELLDLPPDRVRDISDKLDKSRGFDLTFAIGYVLGLHPEQVKNWGQQEDAGYEEYLDNTSYIAAKRATGQETEDTDPKEQPEI